LRIPREDWQLAFPTDAPGVRGHILPGMDDSLLEGGFLEPVKDLTLDQIEEACVAAFDNAVALLEEADLLREHDKCARAYFLAHIACEELGKLPVLVTTAISVWMHADVDWQRVDRALRSHEAKIKQVLFMDSLHGNPGLAEGTKAYDADVRRMRTYTDFKNASLYSFYLGGHFEEPNGRMPCELFDGLRRLAEGRLRAFAGYMHPVRRPGGMEAFFKSPSIARANDMMEKLLGQEGRAAFDEYERTGDEAAIRELFDQLLRRKDSPDEAAPVESEPLSEERLEEERRRMQELTSRSPDSRKSEQGDSTKP
jgi:AbiV family abortive infection protein